MSTIKTIIDTKNGEFEVYFKENSWFYSQTNQPVEEIYLKALQTRGLGVNKTTVEVPFNALLLSTITGTPKHFWYYCDDETKAEIQTVLNEAFSTAKPKLLEIREKYLNQVKDKRMEALQDSRKKKK
jgi:hypothetical protein